MPFPDETVIKLSKIRIILLLLGALMFVALGVWFLTMDPESAKDLFDTSTMLEVYLISLATIGFFGACGVIGFKKLLDKSPGIILNAEGIWNNSGGLSADFVKWSDVSGIEEYQIEKQNFIAVHVKSPNEQEKNDSTLKKAVNRANKSLSGTSINISSNSLKIRHRALLELIQSYYRGYSSTSAVQ